MKKRQKTTCSRCGGPRNRDGQAYCRACHATYTRENRKPLTEEQRRRDNARSYAYVYLKRGKLTQKPCEECGEENSQMHHADYSKPLEVTWLCRRHHLALHRPISEFR